MKSVMDTAVMHQIRSDWNAAGHGYKRQVVERWARVVGVSCYTVYRMLDAGRERRKGERKLENIENIAVTVAQIRKRPPTDLGEITTEDAVRIGIDNGLIPEWASDKMSTINRVMRELRLTSEKRYCLFQATAPNELHHEDASSSSIFYVKRRLGDGDFVLKMHKRVRGYKNKPVPVRLRPWIYGLVDDYSGRWIGRYVAAEGESLEDSLEFLCYAWSGAGLGIPKAIKFDHGKLMKGTASRLFLKRLGVRVDESTPGNKNAHGKIERVWRTIWKRFELPYFAEDFDRFEISLSELNERLNHYLAGYNQRGHRFEKNLTRIQAWQKVNLTGGIRALSRDAVKSIVNPYERTVTGAGTFNLEGVTYEVSKPHTAYNRKVWVFVGLFDHLVMVQDQENGSTYPATEFVPNALGEYGNRPAKSPHEVTKEAGDLMELKNTLHSEPVEIKKNDKVIAFPTAVRAAEVSVPKVDFTERYGNLAEAMADLVARIGFLPDAGLREELRDLILANDLRRGAVADLAEAFEGVRRAV